MPGTKPAASPVGITSPHRGPNRAPMPPNVSNVVLGNLHIKPWFPSFYPEDMIGGRKAEWLYVCQWCFKYTHEIMKFSAHCVSSFDESFDIFGDEYADLDFCKKVCPLKDEYPPGDLIYGKDGYAIHQLDGEEHKVGITPNRPANTIAKICFQLYAQNLSLFAKLFLETKSVFFDANTFLYYTLVQRDSPSNPRGQVVGFFSKEKMSWDNNNVACILVFPPWQRRGLGQILIAASYELGKREGRFGGPERPLSALGRKGYVVFWCGEVARYVLKAPLKKAVTIKDISEATYILQEDVVAALKEMDVVEKRKTASGSVVLNKSRVHEWAEKHGVSAKPIIDVEAFVEEEQEEGEELED